MKFEIKKITTDFLIIGGGTAGCYAALSFCENHSGSVLILEKANIKRSGCLAAGVNAINAYIVPGKTPQDYVNYARNDANNIVRGDLLLTMSEGLNKTVEKLESLGLTILKDSNGRYVARGNRNIKINGENIKPILADAVSRESRINVLNQVNAFEYIHINNKIQGVYAVGVHEPVLYVISAKAVLCATGGASGLYKPNHPGFSQHKMWYPPFNTGAGYAMGIKVGAEMTTLEMRFIALRCKDTIAPTGTIAQGVGAKQINSKGEIYEQKYGITTSQRLHGTVVENIEGRGPCYLHTKGITKEQDEDLKRAYLNMAPSQTLRWLETEKPPSIKDVEIEGTEPYIVGGHTASGYWVDTNRETTINGLFAAGDVAGGCPQKYVTGAFVEGEIAAKSSLKYMNDTIIESSEDIINNKKQFIEKFFINPQKYDIDKLEQEMQSIMDEYAGGIGANYKFSYESLQIAKEKIKSLEDKSILLNATSNHDLVYILELQERLIVCKSLIAHLEARQETRWNSFDEYEDYPNVDNRYNCYINSRLEDDDIKIITRPLISEGEFYEHSN